MTVRVLVPEVLRRATGGVAEVVSAGPTAGDALAGAFAAFPRLRGLVLDARGVPWPYLAFLVDGREVGRAALLAAPVADGGDVEIVGAAEGG